MVRARKQAVCGWQDGRRTAGGGQGHDGSEEAQHRERECDKVRGWFEVR